MNILIVEDQKDKSDDLRSCINDYYEKEVNYTVCKSLRSGLKALISDVDYSVIILDMSMPNFDPSSDDPIGGTPESFAGKEFMAQMKLRSINTPVVVVTQYSIFEKGKITLEDLDFLFKHSFDDFYLGSVYYSSSDNSWREQLNEILKGS